MDKQLCPICGREVQPSTRYPRYVCQECAGRATSADGRPLEFSNANISGGFLARFADTGEAYSGHECFIDGVRCHADEAHLGGIVVETVGRRRRAGAARGPRK